MSADEDYMCPNCVTPWKCNGPHLDTFPAKEYIESLLAKVERLEKYEAAVSSIAESLPCEHGQRKEHPDPATVAAGLPGLVKVLEKIEQASDFIADEAPWDWQTDRLVEIRALASEARSALTSPCPGLGGIAKPQEPV